MSEFSTVYPQRKIGIITVVIDIVQVGRQAHASHRRLVATRLTVFLILTGRSQKVDILIHKSLGIKTIATIVPFPQRVVHTQINLVFIGKGFGIGQVDTAVIIVSLSGGILILPSSEKTVRSLIFSRLEEGMFGGQKIIGGIVGG